LNSLSIYFREESYFVHHFLRRNPYAVGFEKVAQASPKLRAGFIGNIVIELQTEGYLTKELRTTTKQMYEK